MVLKRLFAKGGTCSFYAMYEIEHFILLLVCAIGIGIALFRSRKMTREQILKRVKKCAVLLWILEITKIAFNLSIGNFNNPNTYIPLYFCSIPLYCGLLSAYGKGRAKRIGDVFLTVGGIAGGIGYLVCPSTTAGIYPVFHFITIQSYILHSIMVYLGTLFILRNYTNLKIKDLSYYALTVFIFSILAYIINGYWGSNLMFVSKNHPGTAVELIYNFIPTLFPLIITFIQAIPPFFIIFGIEKVYKLINKNIED